MIYISINKVSCSSCGKEIDDIDEFCRHCGVKEKEKKIAESFKDEGELKNQGGICFLDAQDDKDYVVIGFSRPSIPVYPFFNEGEEWFLSPGRIIRKHSPTMLKEWEIWIDGKKFGTVGLMFIYNIYVKEK